MAIGTGNTVGAAHLLPMSSVLWSPSWSLLPAVPAALTVFSYDRVVLTEPAISRPALTTSSVTVPNYLGNMSRALHSMYSTLALVPYVEAQTSSLLIKREPWLIPQSYRFHFALLPVVSWQRQPVWYEGY